jgi:quercetin dioxygenase-like cupin family protein
MRRPPAVCTQLEANGRVVVTEWRLAPGGETGWHCHPHDYVVVYLTDAKHIVETRVGLSAVDIFAGQAYYRERGLEHNVINAGPFEVILVRTELI